jgi:predicted NBD/HSP70 family sugar kinase
MYRSGGSVSGGPVGSSRGSGPATRTARGRLAERRVDSVGGRRGASAGTVLRAVLEHGPVARSTIARLTGLSPASVTGHSAELAQLGLIRELPDSVRSNGIGRPHVPVDLDTAQYVVGAVHIAVPQTTTALLDLRGRVVAQYQEPHAGTDPNPVASRAAQALSRLLASHASAIPLGLGVAIGGWVDRESGTVVEHPLLGWRDVPLRELFAERTGLLVHVDGHARALLQGERLFGLARGRASVMHLFIGNMVDAAFAAGELVHYGPRSQAGAIAHLPLAGSTEPCPCGRTGCLQATVSELTLARRAFEAGIVAAPVFALLLDRARRGDPGAAGMLAERARWVGQAAALLMDLFDPELVVVVEPGAMFLPRSLDALRAEIRARVSVGVDVERTVVTTGFAEDVLAVAGGSVILDALYRDPLQLLVSRWTI